MSEMDPRFFRKYSDLITEAETEQPKPVEAKVLAASKPNKNKK